MNRGQPMQRGGRIKPKKRGAADFARIYGSPQRLEWVKALPCLARELLSRPGECEGEIQNAHSVVGGMGMGNRAEYDPSDYIAPARTDEQSVQLLASNTSRKFHGLMDAAMLVSAFKYGEVSVAYPERVNAIDSLRIRLSLYLDGMRNPGFGAEGEAGEAEYLIEPGNAEYLVDVANFAMIEFMHPAHAQAHYHATDASGSPGRVAANTDIYDRPNQFKNTDLEPAS
jgi:hypothetical protein